MRCDARTLWRSVAVIVCLTQAAWAQPSSFPPRGGRHESKTAVLKKLPIRFEPTVQNGTFLARGMGRGVRLTGRSIDFPLDSPRAASIHIEFVGAKKSSRVVGVDAQPGRVNYLYGDDPARWRTNVATYARAKTTSLYRGVDVEYYGADGLLEYDFVVQPGARPDRIRLALSGASAAISESGDLVYGSDQRVLLRKPVAYQVIDGDRRDVSVDYHRRADASFSFVVGSYDRGQPLVIDPIVASSFTFGGNGGDHVADIAVDEVGAVYVGGSTYSSDFPTVNPAEARQDAGALNCYIGDHDVTPCSDAFLAKLRPDGPALEYATYVGVSGFDYLERIAVGPDHALYFGGSWESGSGASGGVFIGKLTPDGSRFQYKIVSTSFGSVEAGYLDGVIPPFILDLAAGADGSAYLLTFNGSSSEVGILSPTGENYHSIFTSPAYPETLVTAIAARGNSIFVAGATSSPDFPVTSGAAQTQFGGGSDGIVMRLNTDGAVVYSTFVGGTFGDRISDVAVDSNGNAYAVGISTNTVCQNSTDQHAFITRLTADGSAITYTTPFFFPLASCLFSTARRVAVDDRGNAYAAIWGQGYDPSNIYHQRYDLLKVGPTGTVLYSELDVPSDLFGVDPAGDAWFGSARIVKLVPLKFNALTTDVSLPVRFATRMTWTAAVEAISGVEYTFLHYSSADGWVVGQAYGPDPSYTWTPASWDIGNHSVCAVAHLVASPDVEASSCVQFTINGPAPGEAPVLSVPADFNQDRRPDLLWIYSPTGQLGIWNMGGGTYGERLVNLGFLDAPAVPAGWRVAGSADVDGDGHTDLILQSDTGFVGAWLFNGSTLRYGRFFTPGQITDLNWQIRAVGDLNHDGHPDLIWQYAPTGQVGFWLMNGTSAMAYVNASVAAPGGDWEIVGTGDSNRDGERDMFWQQRSTGALGVWTMNGTTFVGARLLSATPGPQWRAVAVTDLDGDAYSDIVLQNTVTGELGAWYLTGTTLRFGLWLVPSSVPPDWSLVGPR